MKAVSVFLLIAVGYFVCAPAPCGIPVSYRLGTIDAQFAITEAQARVALTDAEALWEEGVGHDIFTYDESANLAVNFVYDERQARTDEEQEMRELISTQQNLSKGVRAEYEALESTYQKVREQYEERQEQYAKDLETYNETVAEWNEKGGAPEEVYTQLQDEQQRLRAEEKKVNALVDELNGYVEKLNALGVQGEALIHTYNNVVQKYNEQFNSEREFTQGDYQGDEIHIYEYENGAELRIVLAHELGHALSLGHVEGPESIMYFFMGGQILENGVTTEDIETFKAQCSPKWYHRQHYY